MSQADLIALDFEKHEMQCPYCQKQTVHHSPGRMILFATVKCQCCGCNFPVTMDQPINTSSSNKSFSIGLQTPSFGRHTCRQRNRKCNPHRVIL